VVVATVFAHGFTVEPVARLLGVKGAVRPGLLIVGANPWSIELARMMQDIETPVMVSDSSWHALAPARQQGLPTYHGEILNEAAEHNLDLSPYRVLVAATHNEAYNTLVCNEFAFEIGRDSVYQLGGGDDQDSDKRTLPASLRGRNLFKAGFGVADVYPRQLEGWRFRKTTLTEKFGLDDALAKLPEGAHPLLLVRANGDMRFFTHASEPEPQAGDTVISYSPPQEQSIPDAGGGEAGPAESSCRRAALGGIGAPCRARV